MEDRPSIININFKYEKISYCHYYTKNKFTKNTSTTHL